MCNRTGIVMGVVIGILLSITTYKLLPTSTDKVVVDTVYVDREVIVPEIREVFVSSDPQPIRVDTIVKTIPTPKGDLVQPIISRTYENTYTSNDSVATVTVKDSIVNGFLKQQDVSFLVKERPIEYKEAIVTKTVTKKPSLAISLGAAVRGSQDTFDKPSVVGLVGIRNKNGLEILLGYDTNKTITIGIKKDLVTIFK